MIESNEEKAERIQSLISQVDNLTELSVAAMSIAEDPPELWDHGGCPSCPMIEAVKKLRKQHDSLKAALVGMIGADTAEELDAMEVMVRAQPVPDLDRLVALNAIHALRKTLPEKGGQ